MTPRQLLRPFAAGVLVANAIPHAFAAVTGAPHLTPLKGRDSSPAVNAAWAGLNLAAAAALANGQDGQQRRRAFKAGVAAFSVWALVAEWVTDFH